RPDAVRCRARHRVARRVGVGAHERDGHRRIPGRLGQLRGGDRAIVVHRLCVSVRSDVDPHPRRDGRRRRPGPPRRAALMPTLGNYLLLSAILFAIGTAGVFVRRNLITILLSIEIMLNAVNLTFVAFGRALGTADGQSIVFFVITVYRHRESLNPDTFTTLKW